MVVPYKLGCSQSLECRQRVCFLLTLHTSNRPLLHQHIHLHTPTTAPHNTQVSQILTTLPTSPQLTHPTYGRGTPRPASLTCTD